MLHCAPVTTRDSDLMKGIMVACGEWKRSLNRLIPQPTEMVMVEKRWRRIERAHFLLTRLRVLETGEVLMSYYYI